MKIERIKTSFVFDAFSYLSQEKGAKALFVLFDAGETKALLPVMKEMDKAHIHYKIVAFGTHGNSLKTTPKRSIFPLKFPFLLVLLGLLGIERGGSIQISLRKFMI